MQGAFGTDRVGAWVKHDQFQAPPVNAALLVELTHAVFQHGAHHLPGFSQRTARRQQGPKAQHALFHTRVTFFGQAFEIGGEVALVGQGQFEAWHGRVEAIASRVDTLLDGPRQAAVGVGRVAAAVGLARALAECQALPVEAGGANTAFGTATAVVAMATGAGQHAGGDCDVTGADPGLQLSVATGDALAVEAFAGLFVVGQVQGQG
ncbi:hypothetical protein D3C80_1167110 [compost metagenome]